jgi:polysaccharide export outer membrane protein
MICGLLSCSTPKSTQYFETIKKDTTISGFVSNDMESKIRRGDNLGITISSLSPEENAKHNSAGLIVTERGTVPTYMVQPDGTIKLYRFGNVMVEGMTRRELGDKLQKDLLPFLKEPIVNVTYLNHKVTILGEVGTPQVINMQSEQMSVLEAISISGDMRENARKDRVMIIRETPNEKKINYINLQDHSIFTSPWYYLQPNDVVVVYPDTSKTDTEEKRRRLQTTLSLVASGLSLLIIILDRIIN